MRPKTIATFFLLSFVAASAGMLALHVIRQLGPATSPSGAETANVQKTVVAPEPAKETASDPTPEKPTAPAPQTAEAVAPTEPAAPIAPEAGAKAEVLASAESPSTGESGFVAYYFHGAKRCPECNKIEAYSKEALETGLADAMKNGRMKWQVLDYDEPANTHFKKDFGLFTSSLVLVELKDGKATRYENLEDVWSMLSNKAKFFQYVQGRARTFLGKPA